MNDLSTRILRTDIAGIPIEWIEYETAAKLYCLDQVAYTAGSEVLTVHGGICAQTGRQSTLNLHSIIATHGHHHASLLKHLPDYSPPLNNNALFKRDAHLCLYCGGAFRREDLSRDHVVPTSRGGEDTWHNVVTACRRCNHHKGNLTLDEAHMELLAVPFVPTHAEYIYLQGRRILADQMDFLKAHFPRSSPLRQRLALGK